MPIKNPRVTQADLESTTRAPPAVAAPSSADAISLAVQALNQATQALLMAATRMQQIPQPSPGALAAGPNGPVQQIDVWEDDPFSEAVPTPNPVQPAPVTVDLPTISVPSLQVSILGSHPSSTRSVPGTAEFRYWTAAAALARAVQFWASVLPVGTRWSIRAPTLQVTLNSGEDLNAYYSRVQGLRFFRQMVRNVTIYSGESPDVVCHELGHAILDAVRPQLWNAASMEVAAFHESFGDMSSILCALQVPAVRQKVLEETGGRLNVTSRLSRLAEQLGWGIRQLSPTAVDRDSLRNAANRFFYQQPEKLPSQGPATRLTSEVHSFSRVFTGAFLDALAGMLGATRQADDSDLVTVARDMGQLLVDGIRTAPVVPTYYSEVAAAMIQADRARNGGRYRAALGEAFVRRGILSPKSAADLVRAPIPREAPAPEPPGEIPGVIDYAGKGIFGNGATGIHTLLTYDPVPDDSHLRTLADAPELPVRELPVDLGLNTTVYVHAPAEPERFSAAPASLDVGSVQTADPEYSATAFVEHLVRLGRVDFGQAPGVSAEVSAPDREKSHELVNGPEGLTLKRRHFNCGLHHSQALDSALTARC